MSLDSTVFQNGVDFTGAEIGGILESVQDSFDLRPATVGESISGRILGNDEILCGNVKSTYYTVTPMKDATHPLRPECEMALGASAKQHQTD